jgi:putative NADH-flavin reductase
MKLVVFGATGRTGRCLVEQALELGHHVAAFARDPSKLESTQNLVQVAVGDVMNPSDVARAIPAGTEAVLSALGANIPFRKTFLFSRGMRNIVAAMRNAGVRRLVVESAYGVERDDLAWGHRLIMSTFLRGIYADKARENEVIRASQLDWTIVQPSALTNGVGNGRYSVWTDKRLSLSATIPRADVARFMLQAASSPEYIGQFVIIDAQR